MSGELRKRCRTCQEDKDVAEFHIKDKATGRRFPDCKVCYNKRYNEKYYTDGGKQKERCRAFKARKYAENPDSEREKVRQWRESNPEAAKAITRRSDAKRSASGKRKAYREANAEQIKARDTAYREANKDRIDAYNKAYRVKYAAILAERQKEWREANPDDYRAIHTRWKRANREKVNAATHRRRARKAGCSEHHTAAEWDELKAACHFTCLCCGRQEPEIKLARDHVIPLSHPQTSNAIWNIQPLCVSCNASKHDEVADFRVPTANAPAGEQPDAADRPPAVASPGVVLSVIGPHAGEDMAAIFGRKRADIEQVGVTYWMTRSHAARPEAVQAHGGDGPLVCHFLEPAREGGAVPTTTAVAATECSPDGVTWTPLPADLSPVTGNLAGRGGWALVLERLDIAPTDMTIDLGAYRDAATGGPVQFRLGASTLCARPAVAGDEPRLRRVAAVGLLRQPYCVWIRSS